MADQANLPANVYRVIFVTVAGDIDQPRVTLSLPHSGNSFFLDFEESKALYIR